jgi:hypothetical protein
MVADDSLYQTMSTCYLQNRSQSVFYLAIFTFPDKIGFSSTTAHIVRLLGKRSALHSPTRKDTMQRTKRLTLTWFGWTSRQEPHWTLKVYQKLFSGVSSGLRSVTLFQISLE